MKTKEIDRELLSNLPTANDLLNDKYGKHGTSERDKLNTRARAWSIGKVFREKRKEQNITQEELAERIGKKREYISLIERGKTDMTLSTFFTISDALGMNLEIG